ncbi:MAG TPA: ferritin-like domain-containing protein [Candidatus Tectomicrobia bacterium]|nr:ferritin-like domain-containing protein [Candidatus Tectomicrobia bacterium]
MAMNPLREKGIPLDRQFRSWPRIALPPFRKQEVDAFTRCRVILMNGVELESALFSHNFTRISDDPDLKARLATVRRVEQQQQITVNWLNPADQSGLETTIGYEQVAIELTAYLARHEPDPYVKRAFDFGLLEDFDHLYRFSQLLDLIHGKDPDEILQGRTDVLPGRPTQDHHNDPALRLLAHYDKRRADPRTKAHVLTLLAGEQQTMNFYRNLGPIYGSPDARQLYAEIAMVEEEHVTQYETLLDPTETWLERWVLHEFTECANYYTCYSTEVDPRLKDLWEQFLGYEIEHLRIAGEMLKLLQGKDPEEIVGTTLPTPATFETNREYVARVLRETADLRLVAGGEWARVAELPRDWPSAAYQRIANAEGAPSETVVRMRMEAAGAELARAQDAALLANVGRLRVDSLDAEMAPNTQPPSYREAKPFVRQVEPGDEGSMRLLVGPAARPRR